MSRSNGGVYGGTEEGGLRVVRGSLLPVVFPNTTTKHVCLRDRPERGTSLTNP